MNCPFCDRQNLNGGVLLQGKRVKVIANLYPATQGHLVVVPDEHICSLSELPHEVSSEMFSLAVKAANMLKEAMTVEGMNIFLNEGKVAGQTCEHLHIHVVPRNKNDGLQNFKRENEEKTIISQESIEDLRTIFS